MRYRLRRLFLEKVSLAVVLAAGSAHFAGAGTITVALEPVMDARMLSINHGVVPDGTSSYLSVYDVNDNRQRSLLQFDITSLPADHTIIAAHLTLFSDITFGSNPNQFPMSVFRLTQPWTEAEMTWLNSTSGTAWSNPGAEGDFVGITGVAGGNPYSTSSANPLFGNAPVTWDLTSLVTEWYSGVHPNNGLMLVSTPGNELHFRSREFLGASLDPHLEVVLAEVMAVPEPGAWALMAVGCITVSWIRLPRRDKRRLSRALGAGRALRDN